jgi:hypothetical protein
VGDGGAEATFADLGGAFLSPDQPAQSRIDRDVEDYRGELPAVAAVTIPAVDG